MLTKIWYTVLHDIVPLLLSSQKPYFSLFLCRLVSQVISVLTSSVSLLAMWETRRDVLYSKYVKCIPNDTTEWCD
jgi:hypothetical protein